MKKIFAILIIASVIISSCKKEAALPAQPSQNDSLNTEKVYSSDWISFDYWSMTKFGVLSNETFVYTSFTNEPKLSESVIDKDLILVYMLNKYASDVASIPNNKDVPPVDFRFIAEKSKITIIYTSSVGYQNLTGINKVRYFFIPQSKVNATLNYTNYLAVCNYYSVEPNFFKP